MSKKSLIWKIPTALIGGVLGVVLLLLLAVGCVLYVPSLRAKVLNKGLVVANEKMDYDIDLGHITLRWYFTAPIKAKETCRWMYR